jgi:uncharacterized protein HemX
MLVKVFTSNPFYFALGIGAGLVGLYMVNKVEEQRKLENTLREMEAAVKAMEMRKLAVAEAGSEKAKKN